MREHRREGEECAPEPSPIFLEMPVVRLSVD
jgi:hypothetical protein